MKSTGFDKKIKEKIYNLFTIETIPLAFVLVVDFAKIYIIFTIYA